MDFKVGKQSQILLETVFFYLLSLLTYYVNHRMILQLFKRFQLVFFIKVVKQSFLYLIAVYLPIIKEIFLKITRHQLTDGNKLNIDTEFKVI